ncbi:MAG: hypothetical protein N3G75_01240 [Methanothrix sp.]|nr:hypothetical protein [Methanothrix sp.]MCX8206444.1 hypothetical protein [Methanothrix sp.]
MAKQSKDEGLESIKESLEEIAALLAEIADEMSEINASLKFIGIPLITDMVVKYRPDIREAMEPIISELANGMKSMMSEEEE